MYIFGKSSSCILVQPYISTDFTNFFIFIFRLPKENISLAIVQSKPFSMVSMMSEEEDYFVQTPQKTISDILETRKVSVFSII